MALKMKKWHVRLIVLVALVLLYIFLVSLLHTLDLGYQSEIVRKVPPIEEKTINVYTGNVVSPEERKERSASSDYKKQPGRTYPITDGKTYRILPLRKYICEDNYWADSHYVEALEVKIDGKWKRVYQTEDKGDGHCSSSLIIFDQVVLSPLKDYVKLYLVGWEWGWAMLVNVHTGENVLENDMNPGTMVWSKDGRSYAFISHFEPFGGSGKDGVWVSGYHQPEKPSLVFDGPKVMGVSEEDALSFSESYVIDDLKFIDNGTIEFPIYEADRSDNRKHNGEVARYRYDLKAGKLTKVSGK